MEEKNNDLNSVEENKPNEVVNEVSTEQTNAVEEKPKKGKKGLIIAIIIVLLLIIGLVVYFVFFGNKKENSSTSSKGEEGKETTVIDKDTKEDEKTNVIEDKKEDEEEEEYVPIQLSVNEINNLDFEFLHLENNGKNVVYSPLSIKYMLAMLNEGTEGESHKQITNVLGNFTANKYINGKHMSFANALFVLNDYKDNIKTSYSDALKEKYSAEVIYDDFKSTENVNKWLKDKTLGLIEDGVDDIDDKVLLIVNALAIDMDWVNYFKGGYVDYEHTNFFWYSGDEPIEGKFQGVSESISTMDVRASFNRSDIIKYKGGEEAFRKEIEDYYIDCYNEQAKSAGDSKTFTREEVQKETDSVIDKIKSYYNKEDLSTDFYIYVDDDVKVFAKDLKDYNGTSMQYIGIMPIKASLSDFIKTIDAKKVQEYIGKLKYSKLDSFEDGKLTYITGTIPKFKYNYELSLMSDLRKLGVVDVFDMDKANLSKITDSKLYINNAVHKATIEMNEHGIKAGAFSMSGGAGNTSACYYKTEIPFETIDITFDKPYMYLIRNKKTDEVWFVGSVYEPLSWKEQEKITKEGYAKLQY